MERIFLAVLTVLMLSFSALSMAQENAGAEAASTWDLSEIYPTLEDWAEARNEVLASLESIQKRRGTLGNSANDLYETLALVSDARRNAARVSTYANLNADEDLRVTETQERRQLAQVMS